MMPFKLKVVEYPESATNRGVPMRLNFCCNLPLHYNYAFTFLALALG